MAEGILLEAGTNELELLVFQIGETHFGINVAKVREIIEPRPTRSIPQSPVGVEGCFTLREEVLTLVNLRVCLNMPESNGAKTRAVIILSLSDIHCGISVDQVEMIHRISWENIEAPPEDFAGFGTPITGMAKIDERVIMLLDFEKILGDLLGKHLFTDNASAAGGELDHKESIRILVADDSPTVRDSVNHFLRESGFRDICLCSDGEEAWNTLQASCQEGETAFDIVITDVEMPKMDGLHLTAKIKNTEGLRDTPVILFSSLIQDGNQNKGDQVGADAQVTKSDSEGLLAHLDRLLLKRQAPRA